MSVNKERVQLLVDALRSEEFKQAKGMLRTPDKRYHCCLGVATEVALRNGVVVEDKNQGFPWNQVTQIMCGEVYDWYGFENGNPELKVDGEFGHRATFWNDDFGSDFNQIADAFERTFLGSDEADAA